ncbi:MAG: VWA domain-containing protein, partial [Chloroflexi bacterium]|nr:VWA domain-containing protein [Chloroflexota bacterium]
KVGEPLDPDRFLVIVNALSSAVGTPSIEGLDISDFEVFVGTEVPANEATILSGAYVQGSYWLVAQAPNKGAPGVFDLIVNLGELATDTNVNAVDYVKELKDQVLVIDKSFSMNTPVGNRKIDAAKNAARLFVDAAADDDQLGVVSFSGDLIEPNDDAVVDHLLKVVSGQRTNAKNAISAIALVNMTSIGDGINKGQDELDIRGVPAAVDAMVLLSDGMENEDAYWADIEATIVGKGATIYAIALGPTADQAKMQAIATATGGDYLYVDLTGADGASLGAKSMSLGNMPLANRLADTYRIINESVMNHERLWENAGVIGESGQVKLPIPVNESGLTHAVLTVNWVVPDLKGEIQIALVRPDGTTVKSTDPGVQILKDPTHVAYHMEKMTPLGTWQLMIASPRGRGMNYVASLSARTHGVQMELFLGQNSSPESKFMVGLPMPIIAILTDKKGPVIGANVDAEVQHPDGKTDVLKLYDDGNHGDGEPDDGVYANDYTRTTQGSTVGVDDRDPESPGQRGSYLVRAWANGKSNFGEPFERHKGTSFQLFQIPNAPTIDARLDLDRETKKLLVHLRFRIGELVLKVNPDTVGAKDFVVNGQVPVQAMVSKDLKEIWLTMPGPVNTQIPLDVRQIGPIEMEKFTPFDGDNDRLPDRWEALYSCVLLGKSDAGADPDNDGLNNFGELKNGTNPCDADTDDGGESDGSEVKRGANPLHPKDDGLPALIGVEVFIADSDYSPRL